MTADLGADDYKGEGRTVTLFGHRYRWTLSATGWRLDPLVDEWPAGVEITTCPTCGVPTVRGPWSGPAAVCPSCATEYTR